MADHFGCVNTAAPSILKPKSYKLKFLTGVASPVLTGKIGDRGIKTSDGSDFIGVELVDNETDQPITDEPAAWKTVRIVLLPEVFGGVWTHSHFVKSIITEHENKKNILQGDLFVNLKRGRGIGKIWIKHDKKHLRMVKFRLGAMMDAYDCSYDIKEAITEPFQVKDYRNELTSKNRSVTPSDKVSKLKYIGKKICERLVKEKIKTVADFLDRLYSNRSSLEEIYGSKGKKFEETIRHAKMADRKCETSGSVGSTSQGWGNTLLAEHESCTEYNVESYEPSRSSNITMPMILFDQIPLTVQDYNDDSTNIYGFGYGTIYFN